MGNVRNYQYDIKIAKKPEGAISNFWHSDHRLFTAEYGWMKINDVYTKQRIGETLHIAQFDLTDWKLYYTRNFRIVTGTTNNSYVHIKRKYHRKTSSEVDMKVYRYAEILVTTEDESLMRIRAIDLFRNYVYTEQKPNEAGIVTIDTVKTFHSGEELHFAYEYNLNFKGTKESMLMFGLVNETGATVSMLDGKIAVVCCYDFSDKKPRLWQ